jgi:dTDP-4-dehydrorhamnose reductase
MGERTIQSVDGTYLILRTACLNSLHRESFVTKVLQWVRQNETLPIVDDQMSNPTWARMLAEMTSQIIARGIGYIRERAGLYHPAGDGFTSRYEGAKEIFILDPKAYGQVTQELIPAAIAELPTQAIRPLCSVLGCSDFEQTFNLVLPPWQRTLPLAMQ